MQIGCNKRLDLLTVDLLTEFHCIKVCRMPGIYTSGEEKARILAWRQEKVSIKKYVLVVEEPSQQ